MLISYFHCCKLPPIDDQAWVWLPGHCRVSPGSSDALILAIASMEGLTIVQVTGKLGEGLGTRLMEGGGPVSGLWG